MAGPDPERYEVHVGFACSYRCVFCPSAAPGRHRRFAAYEEVQDEIDRAAAGPATMLTFSGGEPSLHPRFEDLVAHARQAGFAHIGVCTNGYRFSEPAHADRLLDAGVTQVSLSIHAASRKLEDQITGTAGAFDRKVAAIRHLAAARETGRLPDGFSLKIILHRKILDRLADVVAFFQGLGVSDLGLNYLRPDHDATTEAWVPRLRDVTKALRALVIRNERELGVNLAVLDLPLCAFPWEVLSDPVLRQRYVGRNIDRNITIFIPPDEGGLRRIDWRDERTVAMKTHPEACGRCPARESCEGIWRGYLDLFGAGEFDAAPSVVASSLAGAPA